MQCRECGNDNADSSRFCVFCGSPLVATEEHSDGPAGEQASQAISVDEGLLTELRREVRALHHQVGDIRATLEEHGIGATSRAGAGAATLQDAAYVDERPRTPRPWESISRAWERVQVDWEVILGGNWLARIGVLAVVIGMGFFLKLAFDNNWIGETGRVVLGIVTGLALLVGGEYFQRRYPAYGQALAGGGIAVLYLSVFAAFAIFSLIGLYTAVGLLLLISIAAAALAIRYEAITLAVIGIAGAFVAPFLLGGLGASDARGTASAGQAIPLLAYILAVDVGVLALATFRNWRWFTLISLVGSLAGFAVWHAQFLGTTPDFDAVGAFVGFDSPLSREFGAANAQLVAQGGLTLIFLSFVGATTLFHIVWRRAPKAFDQSLMVINAVAFFGISYGLLWTEFRIWMGAFTLLLAIFYGGVAYLAIARSKGNVYLSFMALGIALVMLTVAVPVQLGGPWVSVAWAAEAVVLIWLSFTLRMPQLRWASIAIFGAFAGWLLVINTPAAISAGVTPLLNKYIFAYLAGIGATYLAVYLLRRNRDGLREYEAMLIPALLVAGNVILTLAVPVQVNGVWIAVAWALEAIALVWLSFRLGLAELRWFGIGVFAVLAVRLVVFDAFAHTRADLLIANYRVLAFAAGVVALYVAAYLVRRNRSISEVWEGKYAVPGMLALASLLTIWVLSAEWISAVDDRVVKVTFRDAQFAKSLGLSLLWAIYASLALILGIVRRSRYVRLGALALLAVPIVKLFIVDSISLEQGYRVAAFLSLGGILLVGGLLYQRYAQQIRGFLFEDSIEAAEA